MTDQEKKAVPTLSEMVEAKKKQQQQHHITKGFLEAIKSGLHFLWEDLTTPHLLWVKIIFFLQSASLVTLYPYLVCSMTHG